MPISGPTATLAPFQRSCLNKWPPLWPRTLRTVSPLRKKSEPERESENNCLGLHVVTVYWCVPQVALIPYSGKLLREKTFTNFAVLWLFVKVFSTKFGGVVSFCVAQASNLWNFSPQKLSFSPICESFLPRKFPAIRYVTVPHNSQMWQSCVKIDYSVAYLIASHYSYLLANMYRYEFNSYM